MTLPGTRCPFRSQARTLYGVVRFLIPDFVYRFGRDVSPGTGPAQIAPVGAWLSLVLPPTQERACWGSSRVLPFVILVSHLRSLYPTQGRKDFLLFLTGPFKRLFPWVFKVNWRVCRPGGRRDSCNGGKTYIKVRYETILSAAH